MVSPIVLLRLAASPLIIVLLRHTPSIIRLYLWLVATPLVAWLAPPTVIIRRIVSPSISSLVKVIASLSTCSTDPQHHLPCRLALIVQLNDVCIMYCVRYCSTEFPLKRVRSTCPSPITSSAMLSSSIMITFKLLSGLLNRKD